MVSSHWFRIRRVHWARIAELVERCGRRGVTALTHAELKELALLYRQTASDLSTVREDPVSGNVATYLNQLLARAHNLIYMGRPSEPRGILHFYRETYPWIFRATLPYTLSAFAIFLAMAAVGMLITLADPSFQRFFLGPAMSDTIDRREMWTHGLLTIKPLASSLILTNNLAVAATTFALGITAGVGTIYMLALNGLLFGVIVTACDQAGLSMPLWSFVTPHGILELPAIFIAGGAGLLLARGVLFPGLLPRAESLRQTAATAVRLFLGTVPLLIVAGFIEGFVSPSAIPAGLKFVFAGILGSLMFLYLFRTALAKEGPVP